MRAIDADALEVVTAKVPKDMDAKSYMAGMEYVLSQIDALPTIEERKTGEWLPDNTNPYEMRFICSNCKESQVVPTIGFTKYTPIWDWCPLCGCKMERTQP